MSNRAYKLILGPVLMLVLGPALAQDAAAPATEPGTAGPARDGKATIVLLGVPNTVGYEIDLRRGRPPGSVKLSSVSVEGDSQATFGGLCAGDYFFAYRRRGEADYTVSGVMKAAAAAGRVATIGTRVRIYPVPAGLGGSGRKSKASEL